VCAVQQGKQGKGGKQDFAAFTAAMWERYPLMFGSRDGKHQGRATVRIYWDVLQAAERVLQREE